MLSVFRKRLEESQYWGPWSEDPQLRVPAADSACRPFESTVDLMRTGSKVPRC